MSDEPCVGCWRPQPLALDERQRNQLRSAVLDAWRHGPYVQSLGALGLSVLDMADDAIRAVTDTYVQIEHSVTSPDLGRGGAS